MARRRSNNPDNAGLDDETIYLMMMLHKYQRMSCRDLARRFGITQGQAYNIIAKRQIGGCCG
ncbi:MAG: helix-turn-helix domain-containing protein [Pseudomonadota bacterium]